MTVRVDRVKPTMATGLLTAGDAASNGFSVEVARSGRGGVIETITVIDLAEQSAALELLIFDYNVAFVAADAAVAFTDAEVADHLLGIIEIATTDYTVELGGAGVQSFATLRNVGFYFDLPSGVHTLYCQLRATGTPTYGAADALRLVVASVDK